MQFSLTAHGPGLARWLALALVLSLAIAPSAWGAVELRVDRDRVMVGETVTLTLD